MNPSARKLVVNSLPPRKQFWIHTGAGRDCEPELEMNTEPL